jgi:hypothetical protein
MQVLWCRGPDLNQRQMEISPDTPPRNIPFSYDYLYVHLTGSLIVCLRERVMLDILWKCKRSRLLFL